MGFCAGMLDAIGVLGAVGLCDICCPRVYEGLNVFFFHFRVTLTRVTLTLIWVTGQPDLILRFASAKYFSRFESETPGVSG